MKLNVHRLRPWPFREVPRDSKKIFLAPDKACSHPRLTNIKACEGIHA